MSAPRRDCETGDGHSACRVVIFTVAGESPYAEVMTHTSLIVTPAQAEAFAHELDAIKQRVVAELGERDASYLCRVIRPVGGPALLPAGIVVGKIVKLAFPPKSRMGDTARRGGRESVAD
ncbi:hypothetical protein MBOT_12140 [Mycobacterium botniense]|uniref:Uncharacterized protein n=1 Tax=Mycobacterium botniense TaxID=84962 RepID=A0A7I9XVP1_9MYCO|nr:hypothetical protein MBOT_12140 [Mycobacterium botniense]